MRAKRPLQLGVCPIGKSLFSHAEACRQKVAICADLQRRKVPFVSLDGVLPDGLVREQKQVAPVVRFFREQGIDALFLPHCNFGTEGAAGLIARECGVPTLLWAPRDEAPQPDGTRLRDSLCGTLATSKVLQTLRVPFSYIENCRLEDAGFGAGLDRFLRAARVVKTLRTMRIGQVGERIDFFWSTIVSEADLLQRFGVTTLPLDLADLLQELPARVQRHRAAYEAELEDLEQWIDFSVYPDRNAILPNFALRDQLRELAEEHELDGFSLKSFPSIPKIAGSFLSLGVALLNDLGFPVGPESDLHGTISSLLLEAASGRNEPSFLADLTIRHPTNDNAVLLWHFEAPLSLRRTDAKVKLGRPWILDTLPPGLLHFPLRDGPLTLCRFDGDSGGYRIGCGEGRTVAGPDTQEFYAWMEVNDWPQWERQLIYGPYIHHASFAYGHCADVFTEAARFLPGLTVERFGARHA